MAHTIRTTIFNKTGSAIADIEPEYRSVSWRLNNVGMAKFKMAYRDTKCTPENLASGNRILIQFENGLSDFGGVIDYPRRRTLSGVEFTAYSGEKLLDWRVTEKSRVFSSQVPGFIFRGLIQAENAERATGINVGDIELAGTPRTLEYHYHDLLGRVKDLTKLTGQDFYISSTVASGQIAFYANWYAQRGIDRSGEVWLVEDRNVAKVVLDEQGTIASKVILVGAGQTWGTERMESIKTDATSEQSYDFREYAEVQGGVSVQTTLDANAEEMLDIMKQPRLKFSLTVSDKEPALFADYDVGDVVTLQAFLLKTAWAYDGTVRVKAREWRSDNTCRLEVEEWT